MPLIDRRVAGLTALGVLSALTAGTFPATSAAAPAKAGATVASAMSSKLGRVLVDARGRTLYLFEKDRMDRSACAGSCAGYWPPLLTTAKPVAGTGVRAGLLGTTRRSDGKLQVTYNRHPLYRFTPDTRAGLTKGQDVHAFGADWYVLSPAGAKVERDRPAPTATTPTTSVSGGYGS